MALTNKVLRQELRRLHVVRPNGIRIIKIAWRVTQTPRNSRASACALLRQRASAHGRILPRISTARRGWMYMAPAGG